MQQPVSPNVQHASCFFQHDIISPFSLNISQHALKRLDYSLLSPRSTYHKCHVMKKTAIKPPMWTHPSSHPRHHAYNHNCVMRPWRHSVSVSLQGLRVGGALSLSQARKVNVEQGCSVPDPCSSSPCPVNSYCSDNWDRFSCTCLTGQSAATVIRKHFQQLEGFMHCIPSHELVFNSRKYLFYFLKIHCHCLRKYYFSLWELFNCLS